jgi:hypothetical protein
VRAFEAAAETVASNDAIRSGRVWQRTTDGGRAMMRIVAEDYADERNVQQLEAAGVSNVGAANLSIASHVQKEPLMPNLGDLIAFRRIDGLFYYSMRPEIAKIVLELAEDSAEV